MKEHFDTLRNYSLNSLLLDIAWFLITSVHNIKNSLEVPIPKFSPVAKIWCIIRKNQHTFMSYMKWTGTEWLGKSCSFIRISVPPSPSGAAYQPCERSVFYGLIYPQNNWNSSLICAHCVVTTLFTSPIAPKLGPRGLCDYANYSKIA